MIGYVRARGYGVPEGAVYCGRGKVGVLQRSPLANPYPVGSVADPVAEFRKWLWKEMKNPVSDAALMIEQLAQRVAQGENVILCCHCEQHEKCHTSVIRRAIEWKVAQMVEVA